MPASATATALRTAAALLLLPLVAAAEPPAGSLDRLLGESFSVRERLPLGGFGLLTLDGCCVELVSEGRWSIEATWVLSDTFVRTPVVSGHLLERQETGPLSLAELRSIEDEKPGLFVVDGEFFAFELTVRRGLRPGLEMSVTLPVVSLSGGVADSVVQWVDEALGVRLNGHERLPRDSFVLYLRRPDGEEVAVLEAPGQGLGDLRLGVQARLPVSSPGWTATLGMVAELPTGDADRLHGSGSADLGLQLAWARKSGRRHLFGHLGVARLGAHALLGTGATTALSGSLGYRIPLGRRWATTLRWHAAESVIRDNSMDNLAKPSSFFEVDLVRRGNDATSWHIALSDNVPFQELPLANSGSTSDITLQFGVRRVLGREAG